MSLSRFAGSNANVVGLIDEQMHLRPEAVAIIAAGRQLSYGQLESLTNRVKVGLQRAGLLCRDVAAVCVPPSPEFIVAALAIMRAGATYLPIDQNCPPERLSFMIADSGARLLITTSRHRSELQVNSSIPLIEVDRLQIDQTCTETLPEFLDAEPDDLAYLIYTSGSTGEPKGVEITHRGLSNLIAWHTRAFEISPTDRASQVASLSFDAAAWEIWPYLSAGSVLCIPEDGVRHAPVRLHRWLVEERITVAFAPTVVAESLSQMEWPSKTRLRLLLTGGEALRNYPRTNLPFTLVNNYGPTECTVVTTSGPVSAGGDYSSAPPIGRPIDKVELFILGEDLKPLPPGQTGEICVGGPSLARGYHNLPELTAEKFIPNPFDSTPGARLYRTGDLATIREDGQIQFVGRLDDQIKIRGYRVEPNEIALAICRNPAVRQCVVLGRGDHDGEKQLIAYIVPSGDVVFGPEEIWTFLRKSLPDYMIPSGFICLDELPLSANGKINLAALPQPGPANIARLEAPDLPRTEREGQITTMVLNLLKLDQIGREENFFVLGGHSLLGAELIAHLREQFNVEISLRALFESPTVAGIAAEVGHLISTKSASAAS
jgi:amino acid adenylation domain-containing protein